MRRRTTAQKLQQALSDKLLTIEKAESYDKATRQADEITADAFRDSLDFLCESGCFADAIGWHYEKDCKTNGYIAECGRMNPDAEVTISVYLRVADGVNVEDIERTLLFLEEE